MDILIANEEDIIASHYHNKQYLDMLVWGGTAMEIKGPTYEEWRASRTPEQIEKYLKKGFHPNVMALMFGGTIKLLDDEELNGEQTPSGQAGE